MTKQAAFDRVYDHFITQENPPSIDFTQKDEYDDILCKLKLTADLDSPRSAIGVFIENYEDRFEQMTMHELIEAKALPVLEDDKHSYITWTELKVCHDVSAETKFFKRNIELSLMMFAQDHGLTFQTPTPELQEILDMVVNMMKNPDSIAYEVIDNEQ